MTVVKAQNESNAQKAQAGLGERLRQLRKEAGATQDEIAERMGASRPLVTKLERGEGWRLKHLLAAASAFGVEPGRLLDSAFGAELSPAGLSLSTLEATLIDTMRRHGPVAAMRLLLNEVQ